MATPTELLWAGDRQTLLARWSCVLTITAPRKPPAPFPRPPATSAPAVPALAAKGAGALRPVPLEVLASVEQTARDAKRVRSRLAMRKLAELVAQARMLGLLSAGNPKAAVKNAAALARQIRNAAGEFASAAGPGSAARAAEAEAGAADKPTDKATDTQADAPAAGTTGDQTSGLAATEKSLFADVRATLSGLRGLIERATHSEQANRRGPTAARRSRHARHDLQRAETAVTAAEATIGQHDEAAGTSGAPSPDHAAAVDVVV